MYVSLLRFNCSQERIVDVYADAKSSATRVNIDLEKTGDFVLGLVISISNIYQFTVTLL